MFCRPPHWKGERFVRPVNKGRLRISLAVGATAIMAGSLLTACGSGSSGTPVLNLYAYPQEHRADIVQKCNDQANGAYKIKLNLLPRTADQQREQLVRRLAAGDSGMDIMGVDVTWTAELAKAGWIRQWPSQYASQVENGTLAAPLSTATINNKLYAAPNNTNVQLLWYRSDLMPKPASTYAGLIKQAEKLKSKGDPHYIEVTGAQYEGLVVWFNSMVTAAGGSILNKDGTKVSLGQPAIKALQTMRDFANSAAADPSLSNTVEDPARLAVEGGTAFGEVNWPYVYASMAADNPKIKTGPHKGEPMLKYFKWAPIPGITGTGNATIGGENLAVSKYSDHPDLAFQAALCLRSAPMQKYGAIYDGVPPTIESVYHDTTPIVDPNKKANAATNPSMATAYPMRQAILDELKAAVSRPVTATYQNVSTVTSTLLSPPQSIDPKSTESALRSQITDALESKGVLP